MPRGKIDKHESMTVEAKAETIINIDSDMYESCIEVLNFFGAYFEVGTVILFDEFRGVFSENREQHGEQRALNEYMAKNPTLKLKPLFNYGTFGTAFQVEEI